MHRYTRLTIQLELFVSLCVSGEKQYIFTASENTENVRLSPTNCRDAYMHEQVLVLVLIIRVLLHYIALKCS